MMIVKRLWVYHGNFVYGASIQRRHGTYQFLFMELMPSDGTDSHSKIRLPDDDSETTYQSMTENLNVRNKVRNPPHCRLNEHCEKSHSSPVPSLQTCLSPQALIR
jgi:hypothetical protein